MVFVSLSRKLIAIGKTLFGSSWHTDKGTGFEWSRLSRNKVNGSFCRGYGDVEFTNRKEQKLITILIAKSSGGQVRQRGRRINDTGKYRQGNWLDCYSVNVCALR